MAPPKKGANNGAFIIEILGDVSMMQIMDVGRRMMNTGHLAQVFNECLLLLYQLSAYKSLLEHQLKVDLLSKRISTTVLAIEPVTFWCVG